jgi:non-ribosomal peptide synthase protein (TIGR01720 family)
VSFLYLGRVDDVPPQASWLTPAAESTGASCDPAAPRGHLLEVGARLAGGQLWTTWRYSQERHEPSTVEALAEGFLAAVLELADALPAERRGPHPADFPGARLDERGLETLLTRIRGPREGQDR